MRHLFGATLVLVFSVIARVFSVPMSIVCALIAFGGTGDPVRAQSDEASRPARDLHEVAQRYERYLERNPTHPRAFQQWLDALVSTGQVSDTVARLETRLTDHPDDTTVTILLARLHAQLGDPSRASRLFHSLTDPGPELCALAGEIELAGGRAPSAREWFEKGRLTLEETLGQTHGQTHADSLAERLLRGLAEAELNAGDREAAVATWRRWASLRPRSVATRLEIARIMSGRLLFDAAAEQYRGALELAADPAQRCRILVSLAEAEEKSGQVPRALAHYDEALGSLAYDHWLHEEVARRLLALHETAGSLEALMTSCQDRLLRSPGDRGTLELLARVHQKRNARGREVQTLELLRAQAPKSLDVSRRLRSAYARLDDSDAVHLEFQRIIDEHPVDLSLRLELGSWLADRGRERVATEIWLDALARGLDDVDFALRVSQHVAALGNDPATTEAHEMIVARHPGEARAIVALAEHHGNENRRSEATHLLATLETRPELGVVALETLAKAWQSLEESDAALRCLKRAVEIGGDARRLLGTIAQVQLESKDVSGAIATWIQLIDMADDPRQRTALLDQIVAQVDRSAHRERVLSQQEALLALGKGSLATFLLAAHFRRVDRELHAAAAHLESALASYPEDVDLRFRLAELLVTLYRHEEALEIYDELLESEPQLRPRVLECLVALHRSNQRPEDVLVCLEALRSTAPRNPNVLSDVARRYEQLGEFDKADECLRQAIDLRPSDGELHLRRARLADRHDLWSDARVAYHAAIGFGTGDTRRAAMADYGKFESKLGKLDAEQARLEEKLVRDPFDLRTPLILLAIYNSQKSHRQALGILTREIWRRPEDPFLRRSRAAILQALGKHTEALTDLQWLVDASPTDTQAREDLFAAALASGDLPRARSLEPEVQSSRWLAETYERHGHAEEATRHFEALLERRPDDPDLIRRLARIYRSVDRPGDAAACLEKLEAAWGDRWELWMELGNLYGEAHRRDDALRCGQRLIVLSRDRAAANSFSSIYEYFERHGILAELPLAAYAEAVRDPRLAGLVQTMVHQTCQVGYVSEAMEMAQWLSRLTGPEHFSHSFVWQIIGGALPQPWRLSNGPFKAGEAGHEEVVAAVRAHVIAAVHFPDALIALAEQHADDPRVLDALARDALRRGQFDRAAAGAVRLSQRLAELGGSPDDHREARFARARPYLEQEAPEAVRNAVTDEDLRRAFEALDSRWSEDRYLGEPTFEGARVLLARSLLELERPGEARALLDGLLPPSEHAVTERATLARLYEEAGAPERADALVGVALEVRDELWDDPVLRYFQSWKTGYDDMVRRLAERRRSQGRELEAYELLRKQGFMQLAHQVLEDHSDRDLLAQARERARRDFDFLAAQCTALESDFDIHGQRELARLDFANAAVRLAELLTLTSDHEIAHPLEAIEVWRQLDARGLAHPPDLAALAHQLQNAGQRDQALPIHRRAIAQLHALLGAEPELSPKLRLYAFSDEKTLDGNAFASSGNLTISPVLSRRSRNRLATRQLLQVLRQTHTAKPTTTTVAPTPTTPPAGSGSVTVTTGAPVAPSGTSTTTVARRSSGPTGSIPTLPTPSRVVQSRSGRMVRLLGSGARLTTSQGQTIITTSGGPGQQVVHRYTVRSAAGNQTISMVTLSSGLTPADRNSPESIRAQIEEHRLHMLRTAIDFDRPAIALEILRDARRGGRPLPVGPELPGRTLHTPWLGFLRLANDMAPRDELVAHALAQVLEELGRTREAAGVRRRAAP